MRFNNFGESSLDILVLFHLRVEDYATELREREAVLLQIMDLVRDAGVEFAFPTRTLQIANTHRDGDATDTQRIGDGFRSPNLTRR